VCRISKVAQNWQQRNRKLPSLHCSHGVGSGVHGIIEGEVMLIRADCITEPTVLENPLRPKHQEAMVEMPTLPIAATSAVEKGLRGYSASDVVPHASRFRDLRFTGSISPAPTHYATEDGDFASRVLAASEAELAVCSSFPQGCSDKETTLRPTSRATHPNLLLASASELVPSLCMPGCLLKSQGFAQSMDPL